MYTLYHWTHRKNLGSILREGLQPRYSTGARELVWACSRFRIGWALGHVSERHGWSVEEMVLIEVRGVGNLWRKTGWERIFVTTKPVDNVNLSRVRLSHDEDWTPIRIGPEGTVKAG